MTENADNFELKFEAIRASEEENTIVLTIKAVETVSVDDLANMVYNHVMMNLSKFVYSSGYGLKSICVKYTNANNDTTLFKSSRNWTSKESVIKDLAMQVKI